jgi:hypothetical protein
MVIAYSYRIKYADDCYWIFLDEILLATITPAEQNSWLVNIKISGDYYLFTKSGRLNPSVSIHNINEEEGLGNISMPLFPVIFQRSVFLRNDGTKISWISKSFFCFHWVWKLNDAILLEGVEDFVRSDNSGVIKLSAYQHESYLLIIAGIFLSIRRRRRLLFGLFNVQRKAMQGHHSLAEKKSLSTI